jgi:hypothetical protein
MTARLNLEFIEKADQVIEGLHDSLGRLGDRFFDVFGYDLKSGRLSSQVRNLQQIVCSATRFADIEDFVKNQMGKSTGAAKDWRSVGDEVLKHLRDLRERSSAATADAGQQLQFRLRLARNWVRGVVSQYLYRIARDQMEATP